MHSPDEIAATFLRFFPDLEPEALTQSGQSDEARLYRHLCGMYRQPKEWDQFDLAMESLVELLDPARAPYFIRYTTARDFLIDKSRFDRWSSRVQGPDIALASGGTQDQRFAAIEPHFTGEGNALVDIGCGKAFYLRRLAPRYVQSIGFEAQTTERNRASQVLATEGLDTVTLEGAFSKQLLPEYADVLLTEVVEHVPYPKAIEIVRAVSQQLPRLLVITAPNREFNSNYRLEEGFRHPDHKWEPTRAEFVRFVQQATQGFAKAIAFRSVGDRVAGISTSLMAVVSYA